MAMLAAVILLLAAFALLRDRGAARWLEDMDGVLDKVVEKYRDEGLAGVWRAALDKAADPAQVLDPSLRYSLYDRAAQPPLESAVARAALPEYKVVAGADPAVLGPSRDDGRGYDTWHRSNGDERSGKYSSLAQITRANVAQLVPAWTYRSGADLGDPSSTGVNVQTNPIVAEGRLFVTSVDGFLISLDGRSGRELWRLKLPEPVAKRGLLWHAGPDFARSRLFVPAGDGVYAVNAATGKVIAEFGRKGRVGSQLSLIAPVIVQDKLIIANVKPALEAYDVDSGQWRWSRSLLVRPQAKDSSLFGGVPWGGMSADSTRDAVYVSTGNPRPELVGTARLGDNRYSCSVVSVDAATGEIRWTFQSVTHDLWDLDNPAPPVLTTITRQGRKIDVLATVTKTGNTLLLERDTGQPIFGYRLRRVPVSNIAGEQTAPYQPEFTLPEPFSKQAFEESDVTDLSDGARENVLRKLRGARHGFFAPPILGGKIVLYGLHGGAEWPGAAVDQRSGVLYVPSNQLPWLIRANYMDLNATAETGAGLPGNALYQSRCASCHRADRAGAFEDERRGDAYVPALTGVTLLRDRQALLSVPQFDGTHAHLAPRVAVNAQELATLYGYFDALDRASDRDRSFAIQAFWQLLLDDKGYPATKPPWGLLTAIDLNTGRKRWQVPFGQHDELRRNGAPVQGQRNHGGVIVTAGGLVFATGTVDNRIRAFDSDSGAELWSFQLPAAGSAPPTTYMVDGVQYVVVMATGGLFHGFSGRSDQMLAFRLPAAQQ